MEGTGTTIQRTHYFSSLFRKRILCSSLFCFLLLPLLAHNKQDNPQLDSLLLQLNKRVDWYLNEGVGKVEILANIHAYSYSKNHRWWTPLCHDLLPFEPRQNKLTEVDAICKTSYQTPCDLHVTPLVISSDSWRRSKTILKELYKILIPIYDLKLMRDKGDDKEYILPFSHLGLKHYFYEITDTITHNRDTTITIRFSPKTDHHDLMYGEADVNLFNLIPTEFRLQGRIDFGKMRDTIRFELYNGYWMLKSSSIDLEYKYGKMEGFNHYDYEFDIQQLLPLKAFDPRTESLDLSDTYAPIDVDFISTDTLLNDTSRHTPSRRKKFITKLPQRMVSSSDFETGASDLRIYGPLNPAFIGYDKINGITARERMRFSHLFNNGQNIRIQPEVGYAFKPKDFRYRFETEWNYNPRRFGYLTFRVQNGTAGFPSRFRKDVNNTIKQYNAQYTTYSEWHRRPALTFDSLGLKYFNRYQFILENSIEITNGLHCSFGADYSIRKPIKRHTHNLIEQTANKVLENRYLDLNPYLRLTWTPRMYYYFDGNHKNYLSSHWPTFAFEISKGVKHILKSRANYCRLELDAHQHIPIGSARSFSWHGGIGGFFKQDEEYFVNYNYFSRSQYPSTWDKRTSGGTFALLDDYWYSSSPSYWQNHIMYETPFLLLHRWKLISRYVIKERLYAGTLWAQGKHPYGEIGYGIGNNYFNVSVYWGFMDHQPFDFGAKFSFEIDQHL